MIFKNGRPTPNDGLGTSHAMQSEPWQACAAPFARVSARARQMDSRAVSEICKIVAAVPVGALTQPCQSLGSAATRKRQMLVSGLTRRVKGRCRIHVRRPSDD